MATSDKKTVIPDPATEFIDLCKSRFGSMNKNDYEVAIFHLLLQGEYEGYTDFELSKELRTPLSKIKRLRYEEYLKYPRDQDYFKKKFYHLLNTSKFNRTNDRIQFATPDKMLRLYINDLLLEDNRFADSSFNSDIVSVTPSDILYLVAQFEDKTDLLDKIKREATKSELDFPKTLLEIFTNIGLDLINKKIGEGGKNLLEFIAQKVSELINNKTDIG